jgi:hypothetical protein
MKNLTLILALLAVSAMAFAGDTTMTEDAEAAAHITEDGATSCFVDADGDGMCDNCSCDAEGCTKTEEEKCEGCSGCCGCKGDK